ncbi:hypothetical protein MRX96_052737, partial [Rhipicephalus microplus]
VPYTRVCELHVDGWWLGVYSINPASKKRKVGAARGVSISQQPVVASRSYGRGEGFHRRSPLTVRSRRIIGSAGGYGTAETASGVLSAGEEATVPHCAFALAPSRGAKWAAD